MTKEEKNERIVEEIKELLLENKLLNNTEIYYNNKCLVCNRGKIAIIDNVNVVDNLDNCNPETITISFEGNLSLYSLINFKKEDKQLVVRRLKEICTKYNMYYEVYNHNILYLVDIIDYNSIVDL